MRVSVFAAFLVLSAAGTADPEERKDDEPSLVREIGEDYVNVFTSPENLLTLGIGAGAAWGIRTLDDDIASSGFNSEASGNTSLDTAFEAGEILGGAAVQIGGAIAAYGVGKLTRQDGLERLGRDLVRAQIVTQSLTFALKTVTGRTRPDGTNERSFPSGHASGTFATATVLERHYGWRAGVPAYAVAAYVAGSRLNEGKHYVSDVVFGAAIGILVGRSVTISVGDERFAIEPMMAAGGAGAQIRWVPSE